MPDSPQLSDTLASPSSACVRVTSAKVTDLLEVLPDALVIVTQTGSIALVNRQAEVLFGYTREELVGQPLEVLLPERFRGAHVLHRQHYVLAPQTRPMGVGLQLFGRRKDGTEFPVDISLSPLVLDDVPHVISAIRDITERKRAEQELQQQARQLRLQADLIELAHDAILVRDPQSRIVSWNRGAQDLYGWKADEAVGQATHRLLKTSFPEPLEQLERILEQEGQWEGELVHTRQDGTQVLVESRWALVRDEQGQPRAILEINRDITQRRHLQEREHAVRAEAEARLALLQLILDELPVSVYLVQGEEARLVLANRAAATIWGASWHVGQPMRDFLATNDIRIFGTVGRPLPAAKLATLRAVQQGETVRQHQEIIRHADGTALPVLVNAVALSQRMLIAVPAEAGSRPTEPVALVVHQDVSVLKEAEYLKDEFIGIAAHELRNPLAVLKGFADMLLVQTARGHGPALVEWQREALEEIDQATARLVELTEELLDVTRLQAGRLVLHCVPTNLVTLTQRVVARLQLTTQRHPLQVRVVHSSLVANIDPGRMEQVLTNLIGNAIKYSPQGGAVIVTMHEEVSSQTTLISVQDSGMGIPNHQHAQIFGRFMRADNAQAAGISGTGLGLYLCRELVERHGGHLWFESLEGAGSTFFLSLPLFLERTELPGELA